MVIEDVPEKKAEAGELFVALQAFGHLVAEFEQENELLNVGLEALMVCPSQVLEEEIEVFDLHTAKSAAEIGDVQLGQHVSAVIRGHYVVIRVVVVGFGVILQLFHASEVQVTVEALVDLPVNPKWHYGGGFQHGQYVLPYTHPFFKCSLFFDHVRAGVRFLF